MMESKRGPFAMLTSSSSNASSARTSGTSSNQRMIIGPGPAQPGSPPISPICYSSENQFGMGENNWNKNTQQQQRHHNYRHGKPQRVDNNEATSRAFGTMLQTATTAAAPSSLTFEKREEQKTSENMIMMRANPHERLWNPSPSKKARSSCGSGVGGGVVHGGRGRGKVTAVHHEDDGPLMMRERRRPEVDSSSSRSKFFPNITVVVNDKPTTKTTTATTTERYQPRDYVIPIVLPQQTQSHLNNSFTEKISNLDLGSFGDLPESPVPSSSTIIDVQKGPNVEDDVFGHQSSNLQQKHQPSDLEVNNKENEADCLSNKNNNRLLSKNARGVLMETSLVTGAGCSEFWHEHLDPDYPYITEILNYWHVLESEHRVDPEYMEKQKEISFKMRSILVDWLVEVAEEYSLCNATLHRCVQFIDRFLSKLQISRSNLQLVGTACLFIACKVEEVQPPETGDLIYITDNTYEKSQLLHMECLVLSILDFDLLTPTAYEFTEYFASALYLSSNAKEFSFYVVELTLLHGEKFLQFSPSMVGVAGVYVGMWCCGDSQHVCGGQLQPTQNRTSVNNKMKSKRSNYDNDYHNGDRSVRSVLSRIKRLNLNSAFVKQVEEVVSQMFVTILSVSSYDCGSSSSVAGSLDDSSTTPNSVCMKYRKFQDQRYFKAATSGAACFSP